MFSLVFAKRSFACVKNVVPMAHYVAANLARFDFEYSFFRLFFLKEFHAKYEIIGSIDRACYEDLPYMNRYALVFVEKS